MSAAAWTTAGILVAAGIVGLTRFIIVSIVAGIRDELRPLWQNDIEVALQPIKAELTTNGGSSIKDAVKRIEATLETIKVLGWDTQD